MDEVALVPVGELTLWPGNPRRGRSDRIRESIREHGVYKPILVQRGTGRVIVGNHTLTEAIGLGMSEIEVIWKDVDDATAEKIVLVDNRTSDLGWYDDELLREAVLRLDGEYAGTGYQKDDEDIQRYLRVLESDIEFLDEMLVREAALDAAAPTGAAGGGIGEREPLVLEDAPTGAAWAETPEEEAARREKQARQVAGAARGTKEIILVYPLDEHREMAGMLETLKKQTGIGYSQTVQRLVREAIRQLG